MANRIFDSEPLTWQDLELMVAQAFEEMGYAMADLSKLVNELSNLTVLEAAELAKKLEARWDVQRASLREFAFSSSRQQTQGVKNLDSAGMLKNAYTVPTQLI